MSQRHTPLLTALLLISLLSATGCLTQASQKKSYMTRAPETTQTTSPQPVTTAAPSPTTTPPTQTPLPTTTLPSSPEPELTKAPSTQPPPTPTEQPSEPRERWKGSETPVIPGRYADADVVMLEDGRLRMYYSLEPEAPGFEGQVYSAVSSDGMSWSEESGVRMKWATFPSVIGLEQGEAPAMPGGKPARWRMYFQGSIGASKGIMSAISMDGLSWIREEGFRVTPGMEGEHDSVDVASPTVVKLPSGTYLMVYRGSSGVNTFGKLDPVTGKPAPIDYLISATSQDGLRWTPGSVVVDSRNEEMREQIDGPELVIDGNVIKLYCWSYKGVYALTLDAQGRALTTPQLVLKARGRNAPSDPTLIKLNGTWRMYFGIHTKGIFAAERLS